MLYLTNTDLATRHQILRVVAGSRSFGLDTSESDQDEIGVFVEHPRSVFLGPPIETIRISDKPSGVRNEPGDYDCTYYSLRKFAHLAATGNPSVLAVLFTPSAYVIESAPEGLDLLDAADMFVSSAAAPRFKGYMKSQVERLQGKKSAHTPNRPELIEKYGYDVKYAMHVVRLGLQGIEFLTNGKISIPMRDDDRYLCHDVRNGEYSHEEVMDLISDVELRLSEAAATSPLPPSPDYEAIGEFLRDTHTYFWARMDG